MLARLLSLLFPPRLPKAAVDWTPPADPYPEQGWAGKVKRKPFRNGIDRYFAEEQMRRAEVQMAKVIADAEARGYRHAIHDEWVLEEKDLT